MSTALCTNPAAVNYNPNAKTDDGSCLYLDSIGGICYAFQDLLPSELVDKSWTLSYSLLDENWVFFHDYIVDMYFSVRKTLFNLTNGGIREHNAGAFGTYDGTGPKSFFVDVIYASPQELTLNAAMWNTLVQNADGSESPFETLTHITIWSGTQCTGRVPVTMDTGVESPTDRKTQSKWSFNDFRDQLITPGSSFLQDLFNNFAVIGSKLSDIKPWFEQQLLEGLYFVVRFEFDNASGKKLYIEETGLDTTISGR